MPRTSTSVDDRSLLTAALEGLELQKQRVEEQIREVRSRLGIGSGRRGRPRVEADASAAKAVGKRRLSEAARKRIAAAQKRRWAEYRKSAAGSA